MVCVRPERLRQAPAARVAGRVEGQGVPATAVDAAVTGALDAPEARVAANGWTLSFVMEEE